MHQQHRQFEEAFHDGPQPQPLSPYQAGLTDQEPLSYTRDEFPFQSSGNELGQKILDHAPRGKKSANVSVRLLLAIFSLLFVLVLYSIAFLNMNAGQVLITALFFTLVSIGLNVFVHFKIHVSKR